MNGRAEPRASWASRWLGPGLAVYWLVIFAATHLPQAALPQPPLGDKIDHVLAYAGLSSLMLTWLALTRPNLRWAWVVTLVVCVGYGAIDEITQPIVNRYCDFRDFLADCLGAAMGTLAVMILLRRRRQRQAAEG